MASYSDSGGGDDKVRPRDADRKSRDPLVVNSPEDAQEGLKNEAREEGFGVP